MKFSDLVLLAESDGRVDDGKQFVEAVVQCLSDYTDFDETSHPDFKTVGKKLYDMCEEDLIDNIRDSGYYKDKDNDEIDVDKSEVINHISNILSKYTDIDIYNNVAYSNWAFGDGKIAKQAWSKRIKIQKILKDDETGLDLTF